jgi:two-component system, OmpR family, response regulator ResD
MSVASIPVVLLSARGQEHDRLRGESLGAVEFVTRPYSPSDLLRRVRAILFETEGSGGDGDGNATTAGR